MLSVRDVITISNAVRSPSMSTHRHSRGLLVGSLGWAQTDLDDGKVRAIG